MLVPPVAVIVSIDPTTGALLPPVAIATMLVALVTENTDTVLPTPKLPVRPELVLAVIIAPTDNVETVVDDRLYILNPHVALVIEVTP